MKKSKQNLTHDRCATYKMGPLYPNCFFETLPGDDIYLSTESFSRFEAMLAPTMHRIKKRQYWFYIPKRLVFSSNQKDWDNYITGGKDGNDATVPPYIVTPEGGFAIGSLADHLGVRPGIGGLKCSAIPFRCYQKVLNDWFLNDKIDTFFNEDLWAPGLDTVTPTVLFNRRWSKDRFTSALPSPQAGAASYLPLGVSAPGVVLDGSVSVSSTGPLLYSTESSSSELTAFNRVSTGPGVLITNTSMPNNSAFKYDSGLSASLNSRNVETDLTYATAVSIPQMRVAIAIQQFLEKQNRTGNRLLEWTLAFFGVKIPNGFLQRSAYLGGMSENVVVSPIEQTSASEADGTPQGNLAGRGVSYGKSGFHFKPLEQGYIIGLVCYQPIAVYSQGMDRLWFRESRYDEYLPEFAGIGDQDIKVRELFVTSDENQNAETFGYTDRNDEFRRIYSSCHGQFRPDGGTLHYWTLTRDFESKPQLNSDFITCNPSDRIFAVQNGSDNIEAQFIHHIRAFRPIPKFANPGLRRI